MHHCYMAVLCKPDTGYYYKYESVFLITLVISISPLLLLHSFPLIFLRSSTSSSASLSTHIYKLSEMYVYGRIQLCHLFHDLSACMKNNG